MLVAVLLGTTFLLGPAQAQRPAPSEEADGLAHVSLTLEAQTISFAYAPDLSATAHAHQAVLSADAEAQIQIGTLEAHRALRIGSLTPDLEADLEMVEDPPSSETEDADTPPETPRYTVWLARNAVGWELHAYAAESDNGERVGVIPLTHRPTAVESATLTVSLHATAAEEGRLSLRWGRHDWGTDFRFDELPAEPPRARVSGLGQSREADTDTRQFSRGTTLAERNESALVLPDGARISMLFWKGIDIEGDDYSNLSTAGVGDVVELVRAPVLRFKSDVPLRFGQVEVPTGNLAEGFAGAYGIWLRRVSDGWRFVFNNEPDSWGTQYDADFDATEIDVEYARANGAFRPLGVTLVPTGAERGRLVVHWGPHEWASDFAVIP